MELHGAANFERAMQHGLGAREIADAHADLAERGERDRKAGPLSETFLQRDRALGERQGLIVAMPNQRDVRLVDADGRERRRRRRSAVAWRSARRSAAVASS